MSIRQSRGLPVPPHGLSKVALAVVCAVLVVTSGCGEDEGVAEDATVAVYVSAPLCAEAKRRLSQSGGRAEDVRLRVVCVDDTGAIDSRLAAIGAAVRRATEDSSSIAYIGTPDPVSIRFSEPILEEADIPRISTSSGTAGMATLLRALRQADGSGSLRESLSDGLR